jgi:hypothetical protein
MPEAFPDLILQRLDVAKEVDIETTGEDGKVHRVTIWIVVIDGVPYVRSVRGKKGRWFRELTARGGKIHAGSRSIDVKPTRVTAVDLIDEVSAALWRKYTKNNSLFSMLRLATLDTTLRLDPA